MDRTAEFRAVIAKLPKPPIPPPPPLGKEKVITCRCLGCGLQQGPVTAPTAAGTAQFLAEFHAAAASISKDIYHTSQGLAKLSRLVQKKSIFDDPADEINGLVYNIKEDIQSLNSKLEATQLYVDNFKHRLGDKHQSASHSINVVGSLRNDLADATKTFKALLQQRSSNVKEQFDRRGQYGVRTNDVLSLGRPAVYRPLQTEAAGVGNSPLPGTRRGSLSSSTTSTNTLAVRKGSLSGLPRPDGVEVNEPAASDLQITPFQQQQLLIPEQTYLEARAQAIEDVEAHIVELGAIFNRLANMIAEQRELVERIEDNVDESHENISRTKDYLLNVYNSLSSNRPLVIKSALVLLVFLLIFTVFIL